MSETATEKPRPPFRVSLLTGTIVILLAIALLSALFGPMCVRRHPPIRVDMACTKNLYELGLYLVRYADDNEGQYPSAERWCDLLVAKYGKDEDLRRLMRCPGADTGPCNYAMNPNADSNSDGDVILLFESKPGWNQYGGPELLTTDNHDGQWCSVLFVDGRAEFIDSHELPALLKWRGRKGPSPEARNVRWPGYNEGLRYWLQNMVWHHRFSTEEVRAATGLTEEEIEAAQERFNVWPGGRPEREADAPLVVLPYPGGRHPRIGFLEGAIDPQRETKFSVFTPWDPNSYVVVDVPEAIWSNLGLTYLAHTHIDTIWTQQGIELPKREWNRHADGSLDITRTLPNGLAFTVVVEPAPEAVRMEIWLRNGTDQTLSDLRVQNCVMTKMTVGFAAQTNENKVFTNPYVACRSEDGRRWIITAWEGCERPWGNEDCPCFHSDPKFPDLEPGQEHHLAGWLSFYEGDDVQGEFARIEAAGWRLNQTSPKP